MAVNPFDFMVPLLQRMKGLAPVLGTDVGWVDKQAYDLLVLNTLLSSTILLIIQELNPTVATDAAIAAQFDAALNLSPGQNWNDVIQRIALLGSDPATNEWIR